MNVDYGFPIYAEDAEFVESIQPDQHVVEFISEMNRPLSELLGFPTARDVNIFFRSQNFKLAKRLSTFYGDIEACEFSNTRLSQLLFRKRSLALLSSHAATFTPQKNGLTAILQSNPEVLSEVVRANFYVYWFYMVCRSYLCLPIRRKSLSVVRLFLADLQVFESLHDDMRQEQMFIYSWMQHKEPTPVNGTIDDSSTDHHEISDRLIFNLRKRLQHSVDCLTTCARNVKLANKISRFLYDSSEYPNALKAARMAYESANRFSCDHPELTSQCLQLEYDAVCLMLQSVDAHSLYEEPENKDLIYKIAPQLFLRINHLGLSLSENQEEEKILLNSAPTSDEAMAVIHGMNNLGFSQETFRAIRPSPQQNTPPPAELTTDDSVMREEEAEAVSILPTAKTQPVDEEGISLAYGLCLLGHVYYSYCRFGLAFHFADAALAQITRQRHSPLVVIHTIVLAFRIALLRRSYPLATRLIEWAILFCRQNLGIHNTVYPRLIMEYAYLIHSVDDNRKAGEVYRYAIAVVKSTLPGLSLMLAFALESLAYTHYVLDYSTGQFSQALRYATAAIEVIARLGYRKCVQKASAIRVRALIDEEIAINMPNTTLRSTRLTDCVQSHVYVLDITEKTFGVLHLQTAKHFGNMGRLFQTMHQNEASEEMHLLAIKLKESLVGPMDFEVGLSLGHLASLYTYQMDEFEKAEPLYLRSIEIALRLFGVYYSGLLYDYRGLQRVYRRLSNEAKCNEVTDRLVRWRRGRVHRTAPLFLQHLSTDPKARYRPAPATPIDLEELANLFHEAFGEEFKAWSMPRMPSLRQGESEDDEGKVAEP